MQAGRAKLSGALKCPLAPEELVWKRATERRHFAFGKHLLAHTADSIHLPRDADRQLLLLLLHMDPVACHEALLRQLQPQTLQRPPARDNLPRA